MGFRRAGWAATLGLLVLAFGCERSGSGAARRRGTASARPAMQAKGQVAARDAGEAPVVLTADMLARYVAYERALDEALGAFRRAGGVDGGRKAAGHREALQRFLRAKAAARERSGLSPREIRKLFAVSTAVLAGPSAEGLDEILKGLEKVKAGLPAKQRVSIDARIAELQREQDQAEHQAAARKRFGDQAVNLVLAHETELRKEIAERRQALGAKRKAPKRKAVADGGTTAAPRATAPPPGNE